MKVSKVVDIKAAPERVFDLIARVEDFASYSPVILDIVRLSPALYRWRVAVFGLRLEWDAEVVQYDPPRRFRWESVRGLRNSGEYRLEAHDYGTRVSFVMEYQLPFTLLRKVAGPFMDVLSQKVAYDILDSVKMRLEDTMNGTEQGCRQ